MVPFLSTLETEFKSYQDVVASSSTDVPLSAQRIVDVIKKLSRHKSEARMLYFMVLVRMIVLTLRRPCVKFSVALVKTPTSNIVFEEWG